MSNVFQSLCFSLCFLILWYDTNHDKWVTKTTSTDTNRQRQTHCLWFWWLFCSLVIFLSVGCFYFHWLFFFRSLIRIFFSLIESFLLVDYYLFSLVGIFSLQLYKFVGSCLRIVTDLNLFSLIDNDFVDPYFFLVEFCTIWSTIK